MKGYEKFITLFPDQAYDRFLLEPICWGILAKGQKAPGVAAHLISIIGAALSQDSFAIPFLIKGLRHSNKQIRALCVELSTFYRDYPLQQEIIKLLEGDPSEEVQLAVLNALGKLKLTSFSPHLMGILESSKTSPLLKLAAIEALVSFKDHIDRRELEKLALSERGALRQLACEIIAHCELRGERDLLVKLIVDPHPSVRAAALRSYGFLRFEPNLTIQKLAACEVDPIVAITAGWVCLIGGKKSYLEEWLSDEREEFSTLAAAALGAGGPYGIKLIQEALEGPPLNPYVEANLALGLLYQRVDKEKGCEIIETFIRTNPDKWMWEKEGFFRPLRKSQLASKASIPNYPEAANQAVRLELLNLLAILDYPEAQELIKGFIKGRRWKVTGLAAESLLTEGDEKAVDLVRELLSDTDKEIRCEAALILATWGRDPLALPTLTEVFPQADRPLKIKILEALGRVGDKKALPFLVERLKDPSLTLRMIAAAVLLQLLNH